MSSPKISIITPNFNYGRYIGKTIQSVIDQDYDNWEHIIVDDGSTDNSVNIIQQFVNKYPEKIILIRQNNAGQTHALNVALGRVTGDIVGWINSDDLYCSNVFGSIIGHFTHNPNIDAIFGDIMIIDNNDKLIRVNKYLSFSYISSVFNGFGKSISSNAIFWRRRLTEEVGFFNESFRYSMDSEYWSRLLHRRKLKKINLVIAAFRWHPEAKTIRSREKDSPEHSRAVFERNQVYTQAYKNLRISKYVPQKFAKPIFLFHRIRRIVLRGLIGEYFKKGN